MRALDLCPDLSSQGQFVDHAVNEDVMGLWPARHIGIPGVDADVHEGHAGSVRITLQRSGDMMGRIARA